MRQFQIPNTHPADSLYTAVQCVSYIPHTYQIKLIHGTCFWDPDMSLFFTTNPQYTLWEKAQTSQNHLMRQFQIPNTHLVDCRYVAVRCASCFHHTCQMNTCDIYQHILLYMPNKHMKWCLPDPQDILLTLGFYHITQYLADPRHVHLGFRYVAVLLHTHPQHTLWENAQDS